ncbi:class I SAM-dependent methyltransferase [Pseudemcibacter sp.]|uniref:class I SAM-dependent methyltransferase n=1 Tax=Pseudemcibacter sp. TaxID=2943293 RepID=UPI003F69D2B2
MKNIDEIAVQPIEKYSDSKGISRSKPKTMFGRIVSSLISNIEYGGVKVTLPSSEVVSHFASNNGPIAEVHFKNWQGIMRYLTGGELAFAESYLAGDVDIPRLSSLFNWFLLNEHVLRKQKKRYWFSKLINKYTHHVLRDNSKSGSQKNISFHYDLGNDFYEMMLDQSMTYSSADFTETTDLRQGQYNKYQRIMDTIDINDGEKVLEIGCGWGGFAEHLLQNKDVDYRGITISNEQLKYAKDRLSNISAEKDFVHFQDYRDLKGKFDKIVSIEMFEAVGQKHWVAYFDQVKKLLAEGGQASIQVITINPERFEKYSNNVDFIQKYTFPGGMLPTEELFIKHANDAGLDVTSVFKFGKSYAETLRQWREKFLEAKNNLSDFGLDERFYRMWLYYLEYCEVGFEHETIDVAQFTLGHR